MLFHTTVSIHYSRGLRYFTYLRVSVVPKRAQAISKKVLDVPR